jgi:ACT domain-containing protein
MKEQSRIYSVAKLSKPYGVSRSGYYKWLKTIVYGLFFSQLTKNKQFR